MMDDMKIINAISTINRALGIIEGISYVIDGSKATALVDAVAIIDEALKEVGMDAKTD